MSWNKFSLEKLDNYQYKLNKEIVLIKLAIVQAKRDLKDLLEKLKEKEIKCQHLISKKEFNSLKCQFDSILSDLEALGIKFESVKLENIQAKKKLISLTRVKENLLKKIQEKKRSRTPRPNWNKCAEYIRGGSERWHSLTKNLSSDQILDVFLNEFKGVNDRSCTTKYLDKSLIKNEVYKQIMGDKTMLNLKLTLKDYLTILHDIFESKILHDNNLKLKNVRKELLNDYVLIYFENKHKCKDKALEWSVNIIYHSLIFSFTEQLRLYSDILNNLADEEIYTNFVKSASDLFSVLNSISKNKISILRKTELDKLKNSLMFTNEFDDSETHLIKLDDFKKGLKQHFKCLSEDDLKELIRFSRYDCEKFYTSQNSLKDELKMSHSYSMHDRFDAIDYRILFLLNSHDGQYGFFLNKFLRILSSIRRDYVSRICFCLIKKQIVANELNKELKKSILSKKKLKPKNRKTILNNSTQAKMKKFKKKISLKNIQPNLDLTLDENIFKIIEDEKLVEELYKIKVSLSNFEESIKEIDPKIPNNEIKRYTNWLLRNLNLQEPKEINIKLIITELVNTVVFFH